MLLKLPIKINNKIIYESFYLDFKNNVLTVSLCNEQEIQYIDIIYTNCYGINSYPIFFPLYFNLYKKIFDK